MLELISEAGLTGAKPSTTPIESNLRLTSVEYDLTNGHIGDVVLQDITGSKGWLESSYMLLLPGQILAMQYKF